MWALKSKMKGIVVVDYERYLEENGKEGTKADYIDWLTECCDFPYCKAVASANDPDYGYET